MNVKLSKTLKYMHNTVTSPVTLCSGELFFLMREEACVQMCVIIKGYMHLLVGGTKIQIK
jgi:hypothetical protein